MQGVTGFRRVAGVPVQPASALANVVRCAVCAVCCVRAVPVCCVRAGVHVQPASALGPRLLTLCVVRYVMYAVCVCDVHVCRARVTCVLCADAELFRRRDLRRHI